MATVPRLTHKEDEAAEMRLCPGKFRGLRAGAPLAAFVLLANMGTWGFRDTDCKMEACASSGWVQRNKDWLANLAITDQVASSGSMKHPKPSWKPA